MRATELFGQMMRELTAPGSLFSVDEQEIGGRTYRTYVNAPRLTRDIWLGSSAPDDSVYLVYEDDRITYAEARSRVSQVANALIDDFGVRPGEPVGIAMRNYPEWVMSFWAIQMAGAAAVELNAFWTADDLAYGVADSGSRVVFCDRERFESLAGNDGIERIAVRSEGQLPTGSIDWHDVSGTESVPDIPCGPDDRSVIVYTSGTTSHPKGVVHSQRNVVTNLMNMACMNRAFNMVETARRGGDPSTARIVDGPPVMLVAVPLFHVTGSHCVMIPVTAVGGRLVLMYRWDPERALDLIEQERVTHFTGVPTMTIDMLASPDFETRDTSSLTTLSTGGAANPPHMVEKVNSETSASASQGYGLSEVSGVAASSMRSLYAEKPGSVGLQPPVGEMRIVDEAGNELPIGQRGELHIRGPHVFAGYHDLPDETAEALDPDGWFRTGDIATLDEDGFLYIVDRAKDMVIRGGENIGSAEVEAVIARHDSVHECAVFGLPHDRLGEEVAVAVHVAAGQSLDSDELLRFASENLAAFKVPAHVFVYDEPLPKNPNGKILKRQLREAAISR